MAEFSMPKASKPSGGQSGLKGQKAMRRRIDALVDKVPDAVGKALYAEAVIEMGESMERTPVDTGALKGSHITRQPERSLGGREISVKIEVGGPAVPYALAVHEDLDAFHMTGHAKFLESTINESAPHMLNRIGKRLKDSLF